LRGDHRSRDLAHGGRGRAERQSGARDPRSHGEALGPGHHAGGHGHDVGARRERFAARGGRHGDGLTLFLRNDAESRHDADGGAALVGGGDAGEAPGFLVRHGHRQRGHQAYGGVSRGLHQAGGDGARFGGLDVPDAGCGAGDGGSRGVGRRHAESGRDALAAAAQEVGREFDGRDRRLGESGHHVRGDPQHRLPFGVRGDGGRRQAEDVFALDAQVGRRDGHL